MNASNNAGVTPLIRAATNYEKTRMLVAAGANVRVRTTDLGNTPLILAARAPAIRVRSSYYSKRGASATECNDAGVSPIISGAASGDLETVRLLLDAGATADYFPQSNNPNAVAFAGFRTPLMWAAYRNDVHGRPLPRPWGELNQSTFFGNPLSHACWSDSFEAAELLVTRARTSAPGTQSRTSHLALGRRNRTAFSAIG